MHFETDDDRTKCAAKKQGVFDDYRGVNLTCAAAKQMSYTDASVAACLIGAAFRFLASASKLSHAVGIVSLVSIRVAAVSDPCHRRASLIIQTASMTAGV